MMHFSLGGNGAKRVLHEFFKGRPVWKPDSKRSGYPFRQWAYKSKPKPALLYTRYKSRQFLSSFIKTKSVLW